jgi:hypothetical protein
MKKIMLLVLLLSCIASSLFALDEETYVRLTAEAVISMHKFKGNAAGMSQWINQMQQQNPVFMSGEWQAYEQNIASDGASKGRIYERILNAVRSRGYNARLSSLGGGYTNIEIAD